MRKSTKGAIAAGVGVLLLVGGGGTLAFWHDEPDITGTPVNAGHLSLDPVGTPDGCGDWELDTGESVPTTYVLGDPVVPGDVLTRLCTYTINAHGNHLRATVGVSTPNFSGADTDFGGDLTATSSDVRVDGNLATDFTDDDNGKTLTAQIVVTFNSASDNNTQDMHGVLDDLVLTATQVHAP